MALSKKYYEEFAAIIKRHRGLIEKDMNTREQMDGAHEILTAIELDLVELFTNDNERFDAERFFAATDIS